MLAAHAGRQNYAATSVACMDKMSGFSDVEERMNPTKAGPGAEGPLFLPPDVHAEGEWVRLWANFDHAQIFCPSRSGSKSDMLDRELRAEFGVIERRSGARRPDVDSMSGLTTS